MDSKQCKEMIDTLPPILYKPRLNEVTGSITASILLNQILYWFFKMGDGFYKFTVQCKHPLYKLGDSWCEELGFSKRQVNSALKKIAFKRTAKTQHMLHDKPVEYRTDAYRTTRYYVNLSNLYKFLLVTHEKCKTDSIQATKSPLPIKTETTPETTPEEKNTTPVGVANSNPAPSVQESNTLASQTKDAIVLKKRTTPVEEEYTVRDGEPARREPAATGTKRKKSPLIVPPEIRETAELLTQFLLKNIRSFNPTFKEPIVKQWDNCFARILMEDKRDVNEIMDIIDWFTTNHKWRAWITTVFQFRARYETLKVEWAEATGKSLGTAEQPGEPVDPLTQRIANAYGRNFCGGGEKSITTLTRLDPDYFKFEQCANMVAKAERVLKIGNDDMIGSLMRYLKTAFREKGLAVWPSQLCSQATWKFGLPQYMASAYPGVHFSKLYKDESTLELAGTAKI